VKQSSLFIYQESLNFTSPDLYTKQSGWLQNLWTDAGTCVHCTKTCSRHQPLWPATWSSASSTQWHGYHKTSSAKHLVYGGKYVVSRHFHCSYLTANKVSKSKGIRKVKYAYHCWKCADDVDWKLSKLIHACRNYSLPNLEIFLRHSVVTMEY